MVGTADPESMTTEQRRQEVAAILAQGLTRRVRAARSARLQEDQKARECRSNCLDPSENPRLSVAP